MRALITLVVGLTTSIVLMFTVPANDPYIEYLPEPITDADFYENGRYSKAKIELGRFLFFDKILSGNQNIACSTCHHPEFASSDGLALGLGEGAHGLGPERQPGESISEGVHERVPRNSPALFNLGAREFRSLFHDGRVEVDTEGFYESGFISPAKWKLPVGLESVLAAQALFPLTSPTEMAGQKGENEIADARSLNNAAGPGGVWDLITDRLRAVPEYVKLFRAAFPEEVRDASDITVVHAANAIAAFESEAYRADGSPFDAYIRTGRSLSDEAMRGMRLFYGKAQCSACHSGKFQTDQDYHAIAMPQIGPGKSDGNDPEYWRATGLKSFLEDYGRGRVTVRPEDVYKFRTPSLRNVGITGPWGHSGSYQTLESVVRHHLNPVRSLNEFDPQTIELNPLDNVVELTADGPKLAQQRLEGNRLQGYLERDAWIQKNTHLRNRIAAANELPRLDLNDTEIRYLLAFLESLTDPASTDLLHEIPERVPSGLPVGD